MTTNETASSLHALDVAHLITEELVVSALKEMLQQCQAKDLTVDAILKGVASFFQVRVSDIKGTCRTKDIALPRQIAMYLACKLINGSLQSLGSIFGKTHSTLLHACKTIEKKLNENETLRRQISMVERHLTN